jgi:hypothetical protein
MLAPRGLNAVFSGIGKHSLLTGITDNSIAPFENVLTSSFGWHEESFSGYFTKTDHRLIP